MAQLSLSRINPISRLSKSTLILSLSLIVSFAAACSGAGRNSASGSSTATPATASGASSSSSSGGVSGGGAPFEGAVTAKMFGGEQPAEMRYAIKGERARIEMNLSQDGSKAAVMLMDMSSGTQTTLIPQSKMYMTMNWGELADEITQKTGKHSSEGFPKVTSTGKTETIAGITCEHWLLGDKQEMDVCMAKGLGYFGFGDQSDGVLSKLKNLALREKIKSQIEANPEFAKFVEGGAFPLKMAHIENGQWKTIMEVTGIEQKSLDDSLFTVPPDYKKMEFPSLPGLPAGKR